MQCADTFWDGGDMGSRMGRWPVVDLAAGMESYHVSKRLKALTITAHVQSHCPLALPVNICFFLDF